MYETGDVSARANRSVKRLGFSLPGKPEYDIPSLPADITSVSGQELMRLFLSIGSWLDFVEVSLANAEIDEKAEYQLLEETEAKEQIRHRAEKTVSAVKALVLENPDVKKQKEVALVAYAKRKVLNTVYNSLDRKKFLVSRELTRRAQDHD